MRACGHTTTWGSGIGAAAPIKGLDWVQRLRRWFAPVTTGRTDEISASPYARWEGRRKEFRPPTSESAMEHVAVQGGLSWAIIIYDTSV